jgi:hypothetical protein
MVLAQFDETSLELTLQLIKSLQRLLLRLMRGIKVNSLRSCLYINSEDESLISSGAVSWRTDGTLHTIMKGDTDVSIEML